MNSFEQLIGNRVLVSAVVGWFVAQVLKTVIHTIVTKKFEPERLTGSGGMPSSHSSTVCAMAAVSGQIYGLGSFEFAVTVILAIIVMHDAMGVRLETGKQAKLLNEAKTDLNVVVGLCVGHDSLFYKYSEAITTTAVTKDRVLGHNPVAALYNAESYYSKLLK